MNAQKPRRVAIYARVSTGSQTVQNQLRELRQVAERHGWLVAEEYTDRGSAGPKDGISGLG
jgi:DNA invertase Pin-like site-specific DNA recombinase